MLVAIMSYILLRLYILQLRVRSRAKLDENEKAEAAAKVTKITNVVDRIVVLWLKLQLCIAITLFAVAIIALIVSIFGITSEWAWITSIELWELGTISQIVGKHGVGRVISIISILLLLFAGLSYLAVWLLTNKKLWKRKA